MFYISIYKYVVLCLFKYTSINVCKVNIIWSVLEKVLLKPACVSVIRLFYSCFDAWCKHDVNRGDLLFLILRTEVFVSVKSNFLLISLFWLIWYFVDCCAVSLKWSYNEVNVMTGIYDNLCNQTVSIVSNKLLYL